MAASGHDPDVVLTDQRGHPVPGGLDQAAPEAEHVVEELRRRSPRQRPQTSSGSAGGGEGVEVRVHGFSVSESGQRFTAGVRRVGCGTALTGGGDILTGGAVSDTTGGCTGRPRSARRLHDLENAIVM